MCSQRLARFSGQLKLTAAGEIRTFRSILLSSNKISFFWHRIGYIKKTTTLIVSNYRKNKKKHLICDPFLKISHQFELRGRFIGQKESHFLHTPTSATHGVMGPFIPQALVNNDVIYECDIITFGIRPCDALSGAAWLKFISYCTHSYWMESGITRHLLFP